MQKELIVKEHGIRLLEAQIATGGIIDPVNSHRIPVEVAYKRGYFDKKMNLILSDPSDDTKGFFDPNTHENLTYLQLKEKCITEPSTGLCLLPLNSRKRQFIDEATREVFKSSWLPLTLEQIRAVLEEEMKRWAPIKFPAMRGSVSAYHLMETGVIDRALFERVLEGAVTPAEVLHMDSVRKYLYGSGSIGGIVLQPSNQRISIYEAMKQNIMLPGVALPLLEAQAATGFIIDPINNQKLCVDDAIKEGVIGPEVHEKLQHAEGAGSNFIAGVLIQPSNVKMSIYQAMRKGILRPGTALVLLEAQAATGYIIDPEKNQKFSVEEALAAGLIGGEVFEKLLCAERAVTGYTDPYTKAPMSLFEAMNQGLIVKSHGIRLLEAQIATGGIIDPVHSHRIPVEVAYRRGYFNQEMNQILSDPSDDTKGFFDPNTHENLTYMHSFIYLPQALWYSVIVS
uniref:Epiplakin-like protein n=1 Tax=Amazona collaria TaxID=241587 RepID=A0A8B9GAY3_9PSIT